jgi:hypothetical protein
MIALSLRSAPVPHIAITQGISCIPSNGLISYGRGVGCDNKNGRRYCFERRSERVFRRRRKTVEKVKENGKDESMEKGTKRRGKGRKEARRGRSMKEQNTWILTEDIT